LSLACINLCEMHARLHIARQVSDRGGPAA
jgi:hypothetical protein